MTARVAYQGEPGAYGEEAVVGGFGEGAVEPLGLPTFAAVCDAVVGGRAAGGVLPLENSNAGTVGDALDALLAGGIVVVGELLVPVHHQLLGLPGTRLEAVERVASHWQALGQCAAFLGEHPWELVPAADTAGAARELAERPDPALAVIASRRAGLRYGLSVLADGIQSDPSNTTRFAVIAADLGTPLPALVGPLAPRGDARSSIVVFETDHVAGALHGALGAFAEAGVNLSRLESRPAGDAPWRYRFLVQVEGDATEAPLGAALDALRARTRTVRVLGTFAAA